MRNNPLNPNPNITAQTDINEIHGIFRGIVEDNDDPMDLCRLRVRVPYLNGMPDAPNGIPTEGLPWASACVPYAGPGYGTVMIPEVGSTVWLIFENNSKDKPVWIGCSYGARSHTGSRHLRAIGDDVFSGSDGEWDYEYEHEDTPYSFLRNNKDTRIVVRTPKGSEIVINEADENESIDIVDRIGQIIRLKCPTSRRYNTGNNMPRHYGNCDDEEVNDGILESMLEGQNYILIETQAVNHDPSFIKLSEDRTYFTNGTVSLEMAGKNATLDVGKVRSFYNGENGTFQVTNLPDSVFQMDEERNAIANGSSEVVVKDNEVLVDNGRVGIRLTDAIELHGPVRFGDRSWGGNWKDGWMRLYAPKIKLATGQSSIILDGENVMVSGNTRIASGQSSVTVDDDLKLSGNVDLTNGGSTVSVRNDRVTVSADRTKIASGESSIEVADSDKLGDVEERDGDVVISGDVKLASGESSIVVADDGVDVSSRRTKVADGHASVIVTNRHVETNGWIRDLYPTDEDPWQLHRDGDVTMGDVSMEPSDKETRPMDDVKKGDVSIESGGYDGWYTGQHVDILPSQ